MQQTQYRSLPASRSDTYDKRVDNPITQDSREFCSVIRVFPDAQEDAGTLSGS